MSSIPFAAVPESVREALLARGFTALTSVQEAVLSDAARQRDLRISSQTGSGKTVALGFAVVDLLEAPASAGQAGPRVLLVAPTRELAQQVASELTWLFAKLASVNVVCVTGGTALGPERRALSRCDSVVVGTPGRLNDHLRSGALNLSSLRCLVLDEADQMLDMGFRDDLEALAAAMPAERRTHLISATFPRAVLELAERFQNEPHHVEGTRLGVANADIEHVGYMIHAKQRFDALINTLLEAANARSLVFVRTRNEASEIAERLSDEGFAALPISGDLPQAQRTRTLDASGRGVIRTLPPGDVAPRGPDIRYGGGVFHFGPPMDAETYTHRSGRTGRAGQKGRSVVLASPNQRRRIEDIFARARVRVQWTDAPGADAVRRAMQQNLQAALLETVSTSEPAATSMEVARDLLATHDAERVVAALIEASAVQPTGAPRDLDAPAPRRREGGQQREYSNYDEAPQRGDARGFERRPQGRGRMAGREPMLRFDLTWGERHGANHARILAHLCRRADCDRRVFGMIDIGPFRSSFEVAASFAETFAERTRAPDPQEPRIRVERAERSDRGDRGGERHGAAPRSGSDHRRRDDEAPRQHRGALKQERPKAFQKSVRRPSKTSFGAPSKLRSGAGQKSRQGSRHA